MRIGNYYSECNKRYNDFTIILLLLLYSQFNYFTNFIYIKENNIIFLLFMNNIQQYVKI